MRKESLKKKVATLRRQLAEAEAELAGASDSPASGETLKLTDLFDVEALQKLQDTFAQAVGVASIITETDGTPITLPSNFCELCSTIIRQTEKGQHNCWKSDAAIGRHNPDGPIVQPCLSGGLWDCGASITVAGNHIGNWLIGQVRNDELDESQLMKYARKIGADEKAYAAALKKVPVMSIDQFTKVGETLFLIANLMSLSAYQNMKLTEQLDEITSSHQEINHLKKFLSNIIDSMPSMLVGVDPEGKITHWNMGASNATGLSSTEAQGRLLTDVLPSLAGEMAKVTRAIRKRKPLLADRMSEEVNGELRHNDVSVYPLVANGVQGAIIRVDDVTERVRIEEMMIQSEKMLSVGGLAAGMAHEINNPLAVILGNAKLLRKRLTEDSKINRRVAEDLGLNLDAVAEYVRKRQFDTMLEAIIESGTRAGGVVTNMLGFSRKSEGNAIPVDPAEVLDKSVELVKSGHDLKNSYNFKDIEFVRSYPDERALVKCDPSKLQQVFFNILINGAQAMTGGHRGSGRAPKFTLTCTADEDSVSIKITDNGPGMPPEIRKRVFEPFFTTKEPGVGTGLGMSVSYFIITEVMGGNISVASRANRGTSFHVTLPRMTA